MRTLVLIVLLALSVPVARAQTLVDRYRSARFKAQAERIFAEHGRRASVRPVQHLPSVADTVHQWIVRMNPELAPPPPPVVPEKPRFQVAKWKLVRRLERPWFEKQFKETLWAYAGSNRLSPLDTMFTKELRARMEARYGAPTRTLTEIDFREDLRKEEYIEFEYWFVLNDSIPLLVMDVNGPFERGLVVAGDHAYRDRLTEIKDVFLDEIVRSTRKASYVDYYFHKERGTWYRTGYDSGLFFLTAIPRPNLALGRPVLPSRSTGPGGKASTNEPR